MSTLYDAPGPRARRRALLGSIAAVAVLAALAVEVIRRLHEQGQFSADRWGPFLDPGHESFDAVWRLMGEGAKNTVTAAILAVACSLVVGTALGVSRMMTGRTGRLPLVGLIELFRGLPVVITIYFASRVLPEAGVDLSALPGPEQLWFLVIGLTAYNSVIIAEIVRTGVVSLPSGQREASMAIGLTRWQTMRLVLLPQAFRIMLPALISQLVVIVKDTSLAAVVLTGYHELLRQANLIGRRLGNPLQALFFAGLFFIALNYALSRLAVWTERRLSRSAAGKPVAGTPTVETAEGGA